jgi:excisionase family DNA binding protein
MSNTAPAIHSPEIITKEQLAERLGVSVDTVERSEKKGHLKAIRIAGKRSSVRFMWPDVLAGLQTQSK